MQSALQQFLQLLQAPDGQKESMVQRVVRQIGESSLDTSVTVVSGASQRDSIELQLGSKVVSVIEPERRHTFPAIALATAHLAMEQGCSRDEVVVVVPSDTYAEDDYYPSEPVSEGPAMESKDIDYVIVFGDSWWSIAETFHGARCGRPGADGNPSDQTFYEVWIYSSGGCQGGVYVCLAFYREAR